jgi:hypothetical protein
MLESRRLLSRASISGIVFNDLNGDGDRDTGDKGIAGIRVYIDRDKDHRLDRNEPTQLTDSSGHYFFGHLKRGNYIVREVRKNGWKQTTPKNGYGVHVALEKKQHVTGANFGTTKIAASQLWGNFGGDAQHTGLSAISAQDLKRIKWFTQIDLAPQFDSDELLTHYGSPLITPNGTVIIPVKTTANGGFQIQARRETDGKLLWTANTDYKVPPHIGFPEFQAALTSTGRIYFAGAGGTIYYRDHADSPAAEPIHQLAYYGLDRYKEDKSAIDSTVFVNTPLTVDKQGNVFFGIQVNAIDVPLNLTGGVARIGADGMTSFISAQAATNDSFIGDVAQQSAMALSNDGRLLYVAMDRFLGIGVGAGIRAANYFVALDSHTLQTVNAVQLTDPASGDLLMVSNGGTSSPMVGPDGDVYYGVVENPFNSHHNRGWLLHFNRDLSQEKITGGFGWDDTPSVVPASMVPTYHGTSKYLLMTKYNRYAGWDDDGVNKIAILDPNSSQPDDVTGIPVMKEVLTIAGPTHEDVPGKPTAVREWCINTAAVDPKTDSIIANSEDGVLYRWDLKTNTLSQSIRLTAGLGEAYTPTVIGADGTVFAIQDGSLFAVGK